MLTLKKLTELLKNLDYELLKGNVEKEISEIFYDSRLCSSSSLFVAVTGFVSDGHDYIAQAVSRGAETIVVSREVDIPGDVTVIKTTDTRKALALLGANYYDNPSEKLKVVGITGTNGKTTTIHILKSIYEEAGFKTGLIGTIGASAGDKVIPCKNTTPESLDLQRILALMVDEGVDYCFIEVSSHALALDRVFGTKIYGAIFTNLSPDHLELHKNMEDYYLAKKKLFFMSEKFNIINGDDLWGKRLLEELSESTADNYSFGLSNNCDFMATDVEYKINEIMYNLNYTEDLGLVNLKIPGKVNVYNSLTAAAFALKDNISFSIIRDGFMKIKGVKGRFESVETNEDFQVIIDFAHTEDGLKEVISYLRPFVKGRILLVFGVYAAPGDSGRPKRLAMGKTAAEYADFLIVTSDNPKNQDQKAIIEEIIEGILSFDNKKNFLSYTDRKEAVDKAVIMAQKDDLILITGKGHETAQIIGNEAIPFNEKEIVLNAISNKKTRQGYNEKG